MKNILVLLMVIFAIVGLAVSETDVGASLNGDEIEIPDVSLNDVGFQVAGQAVNADVGYVIEHSGTVISNPPTATLGPYGVIGVWPKMDTQYRVSTQSYWNGVLTGSVNVENALEAGIAQINSATNREIINPDVIRVDEAGARFNGLDQVYLAPLPSYMLAQNIIQYDTNLPLLSNGMKTMLETDIEISSNMHWSSTHSGWITIPGIGLLDDGFRDLTSVTLHEASHTAMMPDSSSFASVMGPDHPTYDGLMPHSYTQAERDWLAGLFSGQYDPVIANAAFKTFGGQYLCAEDSGGREIVANRNALGAWETFGLIDLGQNRIALKAANGQFVSAELGLADAPLVANRNWIKQWEVFRLEPGMLAGTTALRAANDKIVCAEGGGMGAVNANRDWILQWESFGQ